MALGFRHLNISWSLEFKIINKKKQKIKLVIKRQQNVDFHHFRHSHLSLVRRYCLYLANLHYLEFVACHDVRCSNTW